MLSFRTIQSSFSPNSRGFPCNKTGPSKKIGRSLLCFCKSDDSGSGSPDDSSDKPEGDTQKQELLARIAMLQTQKVRLTDYLDERSAYLTKFAEEANAEFDKIGEDALKDLDEAGDRIMNNIESRMQAFEESAELNKVEIEEQESELSEFEGQIEQGKNEGLFFKSFTQKDKAPVDKVKAKEETEKIEEVTKKSAGSRTRKAIYLGLIGTLVATIADSVLSSAPDWRKVAVLGAILVGLLTQFVYEQGVSSQAEKTRSDDGKSTTEEDSK